MANQDDRDLMEEELLADAYAGMNRFKEASVAQYQEDVRQTVSDRRSTQNAAATERTTGPTQRYAIEETEDGKKYVRADRQVIFGNDPDSWSEQLEDYINGKIRRGEDITLIGADGDELILTATSAGKLSSKYSDGRTLSEEAFERKVNAAAHIDELVQASRRGKENVMDYDNKHSEMAEGGWNYRTAYFLDFDGKYYMATISVMQGADGKMIYNIGKMQERSFPAVQNALSGSSGKTGARAEKTSSEDNVAEQGEKVKQSFSASEDAAEDARTGCPTDAIEKM